jgi:predicted transcriptional regulator of viral defense system
MYERFRQTFENDPVVSVSGVKKAFPDFDTRNLVNWQRKGYLIRLRNGYYAFTSRARSEQDLFIIANKLYEPSYVSMETALNWHGIIPEGVYSIESVGTRKTNGFDTPLVRFNYRKLKTNLYFGYDLVKSSYGAFRIATVEKALLDYFYLNPNLRSTEDFAALRWNASGLAKIEVERLKRFAAVFNSPTVEEKVELMIRYAHAKY